MRIIKELTLKIFIFILLIFIIINIFYLFITLISLKNTSDVSGDFSLLKQLGKYWVNVISLKFGTIKSEILNSEFKNISNLFFNYFKWTSIIVFISFIIGIILGYIIGVYMAYNNNKGHEITTQIILFIISSIPIFIIIPFIINFIESIDAPIIFIEPTLININITINSLITPILVLTVLTTSVIALPTKTVVLELIYKEFILHAKTCGLSSWKIFISYIFKNSFLNLVDFIVPTLTINIAFSLIIERLFQIPGQSLILLNGFRLGENDLIMFLIFFTTVIIFSLQFLIDLLVQLLNPFSSKKILLGKQSKLRFIKKIGGRYE